MESPVRWCLVESQAHSMFLSPQSAGTSAVSGPEVTPLIFKAI